MQKNDHPIHTRPGTALVKTKKLQPGWRSVSAGQRALWFEQCVNPASNAYNMGTCVRFQRPIDRGRLDAALALLVERHPLLRARFDLVEDELCWCLSAEPLTSLVLADRELDEAAGRQCIADMGMRPYALAREHLFRFAVVQLEQGSLLGIACHHIVSDLQSMAVLVRDLQAAYTAEKIIGPLAAYYAEFCDWQDAMLGATSGARSAQFWRERLSSHCNGTVLSPQDLPPSHAAGAASRINFAITQEASRAVAAVAQQVGATPYAAALTTFQVLLTQYDGVKSTVVGTPFSGRTKAHFRDTVGYFVNLLPMVFDSDPDESFTCALTRNSEMIRSALRHGQYPFSSMVQQMGLARGNGVAPLVRATLTFQNTASGLPDDLARLALGLPGGGLRLGDERGAMLPLPEPRPQFPLGLVLAPTDAGLEGYLQYDPAIMPQHAAEAFLQDWLAFYDRCAVQPDAPLRVLLRQARAHQRKLGPTLASAMDECLLRYAERTAISGPTGTLSYRELRARAMVLAGRLHALGIGTGARVALIGDGAPDTVAAMLGIIHSGAAFVPIDVDKGMAHIKLLLKVAHVSAMVLCTDAPVAWSLEGDIPQVLMQSGAWKGHAPPIRSEPLDPAWLMFTSGTTAAPKAAIVPHEAALAHAMAIAESFGLGAGDRVLQFASLSFDEHAEEIFPTLLAGACLVCRPRVRFEDPDSLLGALDADGVSVLHLPTSYWHLWMDEMVQHQLPIPAALRLVMSAANRHRLRACEYGRDLCRPVCVGSTLTD